VSIWVVHGTMDLRLHGCGIEFAWPLVNVDLYMYPIAALRVHCGLFVSALTVIAKKYNIVFETNISNTVGPKFKKVMEP
jgi:hypothetical protein